MDQIGQWRVIEANPDETPSAPAAQAATAGNPPRGGQARARAWLLAAVLASLVMGIVGAAIWLTLPQPAVTIDGQGAVVFNHPGASSEPTDGWQTGIPPTGRGNSLFVDVEGAVLRPGLLGLPAGSRVGDAIAAAGGYSAQVDIAAAARQINLAEKLADGAKVHVPVLGESSVVGATPTPAGGSSPAPAGGLIDINHATADELDTLPGVGPVTAAKIIAAREQAPFASPDELLSRGVVGQSTYDGLSALVTALP